MTTAPQDGQLGESLLQFLDTSQLNCLNEAAPHCLKPIVEMKSINTSPADYLLSDADEQLLLSLHFNQTVRVRALVITCRSDNQAPKEIKLFTNNPSIGFEDVEDVSEPAAAQIIELTKEQTTKGTQIPLRYVRFQSVNSLHIFVESNQGNEDKTRIDAIDVFGIPVETTKDLQDLKKTAQETLS